MDAMTKCERQFLACSAYARRHNLTCSLSHDYDRDLYHATFGTRRAPRRTVTIAGASGLASLTALLTYATESTGKATRWMR